MSHSGSLPHTPVRTWRSLASVALAAAATLVTIDFALQRLLPYPTPRKEVEDAVRQYERGDPTTLVIGSSHARTFDSIGALVERRYPDGDRIVAVPLEFGKFTGYEWVLTHRLLPLADERDASGALRRPALRRVILVTEWWDSCDTDDGQPAINIPARAWTLGDFLSDARRHGLTAFNRNYVRNRWHELWKSSLLMRDRGHELLIPLLRARVRPLPSSVVQAQYDAQVARWQAMVEAGDGCLAAPAQMAALDSMLNEFARRKLDVTIVLYPRKPATLTDKAKATTLPHFAALMQAIADQRGIRFIDLTTTSPLRDDEFAEDFDHVTAEGNHRFSEWALDGDLRWLGPQ